MAKRRYLKSKMCPQCGISISPTPFFRNDDGKMECGECGYVKVKHMIIKTKEIPREELALLWENSCKEVVRLKDELRFLIKTSKSSERRAEKFERLWNKVNPSNIKNN